MNSKGLSRRGFIKTIALGAVAGTSILKSSPALSMMGGGGGMGSGGGMGGGGCCGGSGTVVDPPIGALFKDPATATNVSTLPGVVEINLRAQIAPININGTTANLMTYNGCFPGPTIRVKKGNVVAINMINGLPMTSATNSLGYQKNLTNLHTHGWHVSPKEPSDYVMYALNPGETYNHTYNTEMQSGGTLNFYHPHKHGLVAEQFWAGLAGALVVEDETPVLSGFETHLLILKDITLSGTEPAAHGMMDYMQGKEGDIALVNGQVNPRLNIKAGQVQRWRILNASNARFYKLSLEGHTMQLVGVDDGLLDKPYPVSEILLSPGERADVLVKATAKTGNYRLRAMPYARMGMMTSPTITLMTMSYSGSMTAQALPTSVNPNARRLNLNTAMFPKRTLALSMNMNQGFINGQNFDVKPYAFTSDVGPAVYEVWTVTNLSNMDHPFHQHVNPAQILSISGGDANYKAIHTAIPGWKDVVLVPKGGSVTLLVPVRDYDGMAMFHCHILEHEDIGMMGIWNLGMGGMPM